MISNFAYVDPAMISVAGTSILAIVVSISASFTIFWSKLKKNFYKALKMDENADRKTEEDLVIYDEETLKQREAAATEDISDERKE